MDNETNILNRLVDFGVLIERILHEAALPLFRLRSAYPIDQTTLEESLLESISLFDSLTNVPLSFDQLSLFAFQKGEIDEIRSSFSFYKGISKEKAIEVFLTRITGIVQKKAKEKSRSDFFLYPDYRRYSSVISAFFSE